MALFLTILYKLEHGPNANLNPKSVRSTFLFTKNAGLPQLTAKNTKTINNLSESNQNKLKRHLQLKLLLDLTQEGLITINGQRAFESTELGGYWPADCTDTFEILRKGVENYGQSKNGATKYLIEGYVKDNMQDIMDFAFEPEPPTPKKTKRNQQAPTPRKLLPTHLETALNLPCPEACA